MSVPDIKQAFIERLLANGTVSAATTRIAGAMRKAWTDNPGRAIIVRVNGTPGAEQWREVGMFTSRLDVEFYGNNGNPEDAYALWRLVHPIIAPGQESSQRHSFQQANCRVNWVELESGPFEVMDEITRLHFTSASYVALWAGVASS